MGRRANNPELVDELVRKRWTMSDKKFEEKYNTLSSDDQFKVSEVIYGMEDELLNNGTDNYEDYSGYDDWKGSH